MSVSTALRTIWRLCLQHAPHDSWQERGLRFSSRVLHVWKTEGPGGFFRRTGPWLGQRILPARMSWYAYAFDTLKRTRQAFYTSNLAPVQCPVRPGLVSIVLPVYNGATFVAKALASIQQQTYTNFELIVVDDGSTDATPAILAAHAQQEPRMRIIRQENQRLPRALSNGFQMARGEFLTWTSVDNCLKPDFLERLVQCLQRHPHWDMVYANEDIIDQQGRPLQQSSWFANYQRPPGSEHIFFPTDPAELNTWANNYIGGAFMYRSRVPFLLGDYSPRRFGIEDYDYWMRVNALLTLRHADFDAPVYDYRFHDDSLTSQDKELGITRDRPYLMVFDDFRRDFYLSPLVWCIDGENGNTQVAQFMASLEQHIRTAGHVTLPLSHWQPAEFPRLWCPSVYVKAVTHPEQAQTPPAVLSEATLKVVVVTGNTPLPQAMASTWDLCVAIMPQESPALLSKAWQGWLVIPEIDLLFATLDIRMRSHHLALIEAEIASPSPRQYKLSVIICTYRRSNRLIQAIQSVARQTLSQKDYEVIVVNNDLADTHTAQVVSTLRHEHFAQYPEHLRFLTCPLLGLSHARNAGIAEARGEIVCFLDDDAIALTDWLEHVWQAFHEHPEAGVVGGKILLKLPEPQPWWLHSGWWPFWSHFAPDYEHYTPVQHWWEFPWGANWTARRTALLQIGGFRARYGRKANDYGGGEELIASRLIQQLGYTIAVAPQSQVYHDVEPGRFTLWHVWRTMLSAAHVVYQAQRDLYLPMESSPLQSLYRACRALLASVVRLRLSPLERAEKIARGAVDLRLSWRQLRDRLRRYRKPLSVS